MKTRILVGLVVAFGLGCVTGGVSSANAQQTPIVPPAPPELRHRANNIVVRLSEAGLPSINDQPVPWDRFAAELETIFGHRPEKILFIQATPRNRAEDIRRLAAVAKKQGIVLYALTDS
jgi:biopolymer transport protein ExbD